MKVRLMSTGVEKADWFFSVGEQLQPVSQLTFLLYGNRLLFQHKKRQAKGPVNLFCFFFVPEPNSRIKKAKSGL